jgi:DNA-binding NtrC family response regulator
LVTRQVGLRLDRGNRVTHALLVTGPRGTGKQVVAREAHRLLVSKRAGHNVPFRPVSAPTLADGTVAADRFGVVDKYATDVKGRAGYFEQAHGGILLLDEVGDAPVAEQAKLLTVLQEREVVALGGTRAKPFECLVVAATNRDLSALSADGGFRQDLLDRLGRFIVHLSPLDERPEDIPFVARDLLRRHGFESDLGYALVERLMARSWPGNVRELDALLERMVALAHVAGQDELDVAILDRALASAGPRPSASAPGRAVSVPVLTGPGRSSRDELRAALERCDWNKSEVGRLYGKAPRQITRWMEYLGLERPE